MPSDVALLRALRQASGRSVPAAGLARQLDLTPALLRARLRALRIAGFVIEEEPILGLRLLAGPRERLVADDLRARLPSDCVIGREIVVLTETDSTNDVVARAAADGAREGLAVFAERQRAGRGRQGRRWSSEPGLGLWFSVLLRPRAAVESWSGLALLAALAVAEAAEAEAGVVAQIKWPNDVLVDEKKVAGILIETQLRPSPKTPELGPWAVVGIGINVSHQPADFPEELRDRAGSLFGATGRSIDRAALAVAVLGRLEALYAVWQVQPAGIIAACDARCRWRGCHVRSIDDPRLEGVVDGFDARGRLRLRQPETTEFATVTSGEITRTQIEAARPPEKKTGSR